MRTMLSERPDVLFVAAVVGAFLPAFCAWTGLLSF